MTVRPRFRASLACALCCGLLTAVSSPRALAYGWITAQFYIGNARLDPLLGQDPM
jgi:hypothetical protein